MKSSEAAEIGSVRGSAKAVDCPWRLFVSWAPFCSRSDNIARELGGSSAMIYHKFWGSSYWTIVLKYFTQSLATVLLLLRKRPRCVFVMSPPPIACLPIWLYSVATGAQFVIDAHTAAFVDPRWSRFEFVQRFFARRAVTVLVTNTHWQSLVQRWGAHCEIVPDVPVMFPDPEPINLPDGFNIVVASTFTFDEPTEILFRAAALAPDIAFHVTGDYRRLNRDVLALKPANVRLTGFVPDAQYVSLLKRCHAVMSLTTLDHTMQRGAYEAAYLGRPVITSDFSVLRRAFPKGSVFVSNDPESIAKGVQQMRRNHTHYESEARELKHNKLEHWATVKVRLGLLLTDRS
jgi:glycosyltransferase involved in cell wall biosynthesis